MSQMNKILIILFLIAIGLIIFIICLSSWNTKEGELFSGILLLYVGTILLLWSINEKKSTMSGLRFRGILAGAMGVVSGLVTLIRYFI